MKQIKNSLRAIDKILASAGSWVTSKTTDYTMEKRPDSSRQKLLVDCTYLYSTNINTGIQRVVRNIIRNLEPCAAKKNMELCPVALVNGTFIRLDSAQIIHFQKKTTWFALATRIKRKIQLYFTSFMPTEKPYKEDIVLMLDSSWYLPIWPSLHYAKQRGAKIITVTYDLIPISHPQFCDDRLQKVFYQWYRDSLPYFDGYISISKSVMHDLKTYLKDQKIPIDKYQFDSFCLGSNFKDKHGKKEIVRDELISIFESKKSIYLTVSTIEPRKNHRYIFEAFKKLWEQEIDVTWVIVGKLGWKTEALVEEIRAHSAYGDRLQLFDDLNDDELEYCYRHSKALVFASIIEGYGLPIVESLANKLPVLASDTPVHKEVGGELVTYFDLSDLNALLLLIGDIEAEKRKLIQVDAEEIKMADWGESAQELLEKTLAMTNDSKQKHTQV